MVAKPKRTIKGAGCVETPESNPTPRPLMFLHFDGFNEGPLRGMQMLHAHAQICEIVCIPGAFLGKRADWNVEVRVNVTSHKRS